MSASRMMFTLRIVALVLLFSSFTFAQGTRTWEQSRFDEFEKGTAKGVAIRSDGSLELAPAAKPLYTTPSTYIWAVAGDAQGAIYAATGAPARVYRITPDGEARVIFAPQELQVQALAVDRDGVVYAATSPDGKVYRIDRKGGGAAKPLPPNQTSAPKAVENAQTKVPVDPAYTASVLFEPKTKYIWALALDGEGNLYIATGDRGEIFRVLRNGTSSLFFKSDEAHIRAITFDPKGNLIAGSDGSGLVYRIAPSGEGFVLYSAPKKEITALAIDGEGNIYAAGSGEKRASTSATSTTLPISPGPLATPIPVGPSTPLTSALTAPTLTAPIPLSGLGAAGSEVYRVAPDGSPKRIWTSREDLVYALGFDRSGRLLAGTGNKGKIYALDTTGGEFADLMKLSANQIVGFTRSPDGSLCAATSNLGKLFVLQDSEQREGSYESDVFDSKIFSRWGRMEMRGRGNVELFARSGNVDNPDRNWSPWRKIDTQNNPVADVPAARFLQWRAVLHSGNTAPTLDSVRVSYLSKNVAPEVDDVTVQVGYRFPSTPRTVSQVLSLSDATTSAITQATPAATSRDRDYIAVRWTARDENEDQLSYAIYYRGENETRWKLLKDGLADRFYSFESALLPDGGYAMRVVASDAPSHSPDDALTGTKESAHFEVDSTPPRIDNLAGTLDSNELHITFTSTDSFSTIRRAEYSIDAGDWQFIAPVGGLSDARQENYDFSVVVPGIANAEEEPSAPPAKGKPAKGRRQKQQPPTLAAQEEHLVVVRTFDRFDNMGSAKVVVRPSAK